MKSRYDRAVAEADRLDPGWRIEDIERKRVRPGAGKDSAEVLGSTGAALVLPTKAEREALYAATEVEPDERLDAATKRQLAEFVGRNRAVLPALRGLVDRPTGRFVLEVRKNFLTIPLPHAETLRHQVHLLVADALLSLDAGDDDKALVSCRAAICASRSLMDEPFSISQLVRVACDAKAQQAIFLVLARGRPSAAALGMTQDLLALEADQSISLIGLRGERAALFATFGHLADGSLPFNDFSATDGPANEIPAALQAFLVKSGLIRISQGIMLERMTRLVEVVRKPSWTWHEGIARFEESLSEAPKVDMKRNPEDLLPSLFVPATSPLVHGELRTDALGRSLVILIAAERYALSHGHWPASVEALVTESFVESVPTDPLTGRPMRLVNNEGRLIAYSLGLNGRDDGGDVAGSSGRKVEESADVGFALSRDRKR